MFSSSTYRTPSTRTTIADCTLGSMSYSYSRTSYEALFSTESLSALENSPTMDASPMIRSQSLHGTAMPRSSSRIWKHKPRRARTRSDDNLELPPQGSLQRQGSEDSASASLMRMFSSSHGSPPKPEERPPVDKALREENELLKQQVQILQVTLEQKEKERAADALADWEDSMIKRRTSGESEASLAQRTPRGGRRLVDIPTDALLETPEHEKPAVEQAIQLSLQLAEAQAEIDDLKSQLMRQKQTIHVLQSDAVLKSNTIRQLESIQVKYEEILRKEYYKIDG